MGTKGQKLYKAKIKLRDGTFISEEGLAWSKLNYADHLAGVHGVPVSRVQVINPDKETFEGKFGANGFNINAAVAMQYRDHDSSGNSKRVWRIGWAGDQFEILTRTQFLELEGMCKMFSIPLTEAED